MSSIQDSLWFQRLPQMRAAEQRGQGMGVGMPGMGGYDPMAANPLYGNVIGGYDSPLASETVMPAAGQGAPPPAAPAADPNAGTTVAQTLIPAPGYPPGTMMTPDGTRIYPPGTVPPLQAMQDQPPAEGANTNPNSGANVAAANAQAQGQNVPTGGSSPQQPSAPVPPNGAAPRAPAAQQRSAADTGMMPVDPNTLAGLMALNPVLAAQLLSYFAGQMGMGMGQQTAPTPQADEQLPQQPNRNISGINFRFG